MKTYRVLLLGSGGREHALAYRLKHSISVSHICIAPGSSAMSALGHVFPIKGIDFEGIAALIRQEQINLVIVGPEDPLDQGLYDFLQSHNDLKDVLFCGPSQAGAKLESSKAFAKDFMLRHHVPTANYRVFSSAQFQEAKDYIQNHTYPVVLKADGLAAGKGVLICHHPEEAMAGLEQIIQQRVFGKAGDQLVVEEFLAGIEFSVFVLTDGIDYVMLPQAKDYKRIGEGDTGLNTGGMGAVSPVPFVDEAMLEKVSEQIILPTLNGLQKENIHYRGFLYVGLMKVGDQPYVIEYNCRMGDPETQAVMMRVESDFGMLCAAAAGGDLKGHSIHISPKAAATVVLVSGGYPGVYEKGKVIYGLEDDGPALVFHAGTKRTEAGWQTDGGRVLAVTALEDSLPLALEQAYNGAKKLCFEGMYYRKDIGRDVLPFLQPTVS